MTQYDDTNSGMISKNDNKTNDNQPDFKGFVNVEGVEYWVSAWAKVAGPNAKNPGRKFLSIAITKKDQQQAAMPNASPDKPDEDDQLPW